MNFYDIYLFLNVFINFLRTNFLPKNSWHHMQIFIYLTDVNVELAMREAGKRSIRRIEVTWPQYNQMRMNLGRYCNKCP